jgi:hypothetical protein
VTRHKLIGSFVLAEISDDYEEPEHVYENVAERARICGMSVQQLEIRTMLLELVQMGLAKTYILSTREPAIEVQGPPSLDNIHDFYFWITEEGKTALSSLRRCWPLDDEDSLLPGWSPPLI